jgi:hypothetical protein
MAGPLPVHKTWDGIDPAEVREPRRPRFGLQPSSLLKQLRLGVLWSSSGQGSNNEVDHLPKFGRPISFLSIHCVIYKESGGHRIAADAGGGDPNAASIGPAAPPAANQRAKSPK